MIRVYLALKMGGLTPRQLDEIVDKQLDLCHQFGIIGVSPWKKERVHYLDKDWDKPIQASPSLLKVLSKMDKDEIRSCQVLINTTGDKFSKGGEVETWFNRFYLWKPTLIVDPSSYQSLRGRESDLIVDNLSVALIMVKGYWGTRIKRMAWRLKVVYHPTRIIQRARDFIGGWK